MCLSNCFDDDGNVFAVNFGGSFAHSHGYEQYRNRVYLGLLNMESTILTWLSRVATMELLR